MIYCMSDIHGEYDRFLEMLERIRFSARDTLYILGDVIDRKSGGIDILRKIMETPNMKMLLGNHEQMCLYTFAPCQGFMAKQLWEQNGGACTYLEMTRFCSDEERKKIIAFLLSLPDHLDIQVGRRQFHLVHACPSDNPDDRLWKRPNMRDERPFEDRIAIVGHTPTCYITERFGEPFTIYFGNGIIDVDCGCGNDTEYRRLGCLRLDDLAQFYV